MVILIFNFLFKGYLTMLSEEGIDEISEGEVVCEGSGWNTPQPCIDSEFCNGVNTTCPVVGGTSVRFDFGMSTADWATFDVSQWNRSIFSFIFNQNW